MEKVDMYNDEFSIAGYEWIDYCGSGGGYL